MHIVKGPQLSWTMAEGLYRHLVEEPARSVLTDLKTSKAFSAQLSTTDAASLLIRRCHLRSFAGLAKINIGLSRGVFFSGQQPHR
jgi:hypothetical protein